MDLIMTMFVLSHILTVPIAPASIACQSCMVNCADDASEPEDCSSDCTQAVEKCNNPNDGTTYCCADGDCCSSLGFCNPIQGDECGPGACDEVCPECSCEENCIHTNGAEGAFKIIRNVLSASKCCDECRDHEKENCLSWMFIEGMVDCYKAGDCFLYNQLLGSCQSPDDGCISGSFIKDDCIDNDDCCDGRKCKKGECKGKSKSSSSSSSKSKSKEKLTEQRDEYTNIYKSDHSDVNYNDVSSIDNNETISISLSPQTSILLAFIVLFILITIWICFLKDKIIFQQ